MSPVNEVMQQFYNFKGQIAPTIITIIYWLVSIPGQYWHLMG